MAGIALSPTRYSRVTAWVSAYDAKYGNQEPTSRKFLRDSQTVHSLGLKLSGLALLDRLGSMMIGLSASTKKNNSNIIQYDYKRSDMSVMVSYQLAE